MENTENITKEQYQNKILELLNTRNELLNEQNRLLIKMAISLKHQNKVLESGLEYIGNYV